MPPLKAEHLVILIIFFVMRRVPRPSAFFSSFFSSFILGGDENGLRRGATVGVLSMGVLSASSSESRSTTALGPANTVGASLQIGGSPTSDLNS